jgi:hypothetical protein
MRCVTYCVIKLTLFPLTFFQMTVFIIVLRGGVPVGLLVVKDPQIWPLEWDTWTYCIIE